MTRAPAPVSLVATVKNEGPYLLEWVAYHLEIGFRHILIFQNDSDDTTVRTLNALAEGGAIAFFHNNGAAPGRHQLRAYRRASEMEAFTSTPWAMALDADEFLNIHAGDGHLSDLLEALPAADQVHLNWRVFGAGGAEMPDPGPLVIERFTQAQSVDGLIARDRQFKTLFRTAAFARPGIHNALGAKIPKEEIRTTNGSGAHVSEMRFRLGHRASDPGGYRYAQVNHYMVRDAASFVLKGVRGTAHGDARNFGQAYWKKNNLNEVEDRTILRHGPAVRRRMAALDAASGGRLMALRTKAYALHAERFSTVHATPEGAALYAYCLAHP